MILMATISFWFSENASWNVTYAKLKRILMLSCELELGKSCVNVVCEIYLHFRVASVANFLHNPKAVSFKQRFATNLNIRLLGCWLRFVTILFQETCSCFSWTKGWKSKCSFGEKYAMKKLQSNSRFALVSMMLTWRCYERFWLLSWKILFLFTENFVQLIRVWKCSNVNRL